MINREISWLAFNARVLQEAEDPTVPLIERLKFLGIFSSNLDEFFRVRVGTLIRMIDAGIKAKSVFGASPKKILDKIHDIVIIQRERFDKVFPVLYSELGRENIFVINERELNQEQENFVRDYFREKVRPTLVPIMLGEEQEFPYLRNQIIYLAIYLSRKDRPDDACYALIEVPADVLPRFIVLPAIGSNKYIIMLDDVIRYGLREIFSIFDYDQFSAYTIKLTRDAEIDIHDDVTKSFFEKIEKSLQQREKGRPVRFVYDRDMPKDLLDFVLKKNGLQNFDNVIPGGRYHNARDFINFPNVGSRALEYEKITPIPHAHIERHNSLLRAIAERDLLLHFPYQSFDYIIDLLREAAIDPKVKSIKMTLYRVAKNSNVINALINARKNGKKVTVLMEWQARFDEQANIYWTKILEQEGAKIIDGVPGLKVHAKLCLITRSEDNRDTNFAVIGTGNFNEATARIYSDHTLFTAHKGITREVAKVFSFLENNYKTYTYKHLIVSPFYMRKRFLALIKNEIKNARAGKPAAIDIKLNSLVDQAMIKRLYEASQAGVKIRMIIRGICSLVPGVSKLSENIDAISIVDKFLEHSRLFIFHNAGEEKFYLSSADWMVRNLENRVEVAVPIYDPELQQEVRAFMDIQFADNTRARRIDEKQTNPYRRGGEQKHRAQFEFYDYLKALHRSRKAADEEEKSASQAGAEKTRCS